MKSKLLLLTAMVFGCFAASGQDWAKARLDKSPRHAEWVEVKNGSRTVRCFIVYPEVKNPAPAVLVIHEIFGLTDWARGVADQLAAAGYIAIAPDLLSGMGANGGGTSAFADRDAVMGAVSALPPDQVTGDLNAAADYVKSLPSFNGKLAVAGFCWGGGQSFRFACNRGDLKAAYVFYGPPLKDTAQMEKINCPVYGFYGGNDSRISSSVPKTEKQMKADGKTYEPVIYDGAGHGFMRDAEDPQPSTTPDIHAANMKAHDESWERWKKLLLKL
jgi:carboxymethylenebutenolidase